MLSVLRKVTAMQASTHPNDGPADLSDMPIFVDLDGALLRGDLAQEHLVKRLFHSRDLMQSSDPDRDMTPVETLPYNGEVLTYLRGEKANGRPIILTSKSNRQIAGRISQHLGLFDGVIAAEQGQALTAQAKLDAVTDAAGGQDFEYIGSDRTDLTIWQAATVVGFVNISGRGIAASKTVSVNLNSSPPLWRGLLKAARPHHWAKNALVFLPLFFSHSYAVPGLAGLSWIAFALFCLFASSIYILNDLTDIDADRAHPNKKNRPFAAGNVRPLQGLVFALSLLTLSFLASALAFGVAMTFVFGLYVALTCTYSLWLKKYAVADVVTLTCLYTMRVFAGGVAIGFLPSVWLLNFSLFFFLSLALMKRYIELVRVRDLGQKKSRGYRVSDLEAILPMGLVAGGLAVMTLTVYLNSDFVAASYAAPRLLWGVAPMVLFWIYRSWLKAQRGLIGHDPVVFALSDRVSLVTIGLSCVLVVVSKYLPAGGLLQ